MRYIADAQQQLAKERIDLAYTSLDWAASSAITADLRNQIKDLCVTIDNVAAKRLATADSMYTDKKYKEALRIYRGLMRMVALKSGQAASKKIAELEKDPGFREASRIAKAQDIYDQIHGILHCPADNAPAQPANELDPTAPPENPEEVDLTAHFNRALVAPSVDKVQLSAMLDNLIKVYPDTPSGKLSKQLRERLQADPKFAVALDQQRKEDDLRQNYNLAVNYEQAGKLTLAADLFKKVQADAPRSDWGIKAEYRLARVLEAMKEKK